VVVPLAPRLLSDDMVSLKQAAMAGLGIVALPGYVCRDEQKTGALRRVLPTWIAADSTLTALMPFRQGLLPSVRAFVDHLSAEFPKAVLI
jgi:DNA-binding transcriptional LysR family regulator